MAGQEERVRAAEQLSAQRNDDLELLRRELGSTRRDFLIQNQRARSAETRVDELGAELWSVRVELEAEIATARAELEAARRETLAEIERLATWRDRLVPLVGAVRSSIEDARGRAAGIGDRVDEAVDPLSEAISALSDRLAAFAELAALPADGADGPATRRPLHVIELDEQLDERPERPGPRRSRPAEPEPARPHSRSHPLP